MRNLEEIPVDSSKEDMRLYMPVSNGSAQKFLSLPGAGVEHKAWGVSPRSGAVSESLARETGDISH